MIARSDENNDQMNFVKDAIETISSSKLSHEVYCASVIGFDGSIITTSGLPCVVGSLCSIKSVHGEMSTGEVVRIHKKSLDIIPHETKFPVQIGNTVTLLQDRQKVEVGPRLLGRVLDGLGNPLEEF